MSNRRKRQQQPMAVDDDGLSKLLSGIVLLSAISVAAASASRDELNDEPQRSDMLTRQLRPDPSYPTYSPTAPWPTWAPTAGDGQDGGTSAPVITETDDTAPPSPALQVPAGPSNIATSASPTAGGSHHNKPPAYVSPPAYNTPPAYESPPSYNSPPYGYNTPPVHSQSGYYDTSHHGYDNQRSRRFDSNWSWNGSSWSWSWNWSSEYHGYSSSKAGKGSNLGEYNQWWYGWKNPANYWQHGYHWSGVGHYGKSSKGSYWQQGHQWSDVGQYGKSGKGSYWQQGSHWSDNGSWTPHTTHFEGLDIHGSNWQGGTSPPERTSWGWIAHGKSAKSKSAKSKATKTAGWGGDWGWSWGGKLPIHPPTVPPSSTPRPSDTSKPPTIPTAAPNQEGSPTYTPTIKAIPSSSPSTHYPTYNPTPSVTSPPPVTTSPTGAPFTITMKPTPISTESPTSHPTFLSSGHPSAFPSQTSSPTESPTNSTSSMPSSMPSQFFNGTISPTASPTNMPIVVVFPPLQQILYPEAASENSFFGSSVAVEGNTLAVGVQGDDQGIGSVRVYVNNNADFEFQSLLKPDDGIANDDFGRAVAISGNFIIVGSQRHDAEGENSGAAYIYERYVNGDGDIEWSQVAKLTPPEPEADERFGISVSIQGKVAIVGANGNDSNGENSGAAYLFTLQPNIIGVEEWKFTKKLVAPDGAPGDNFGFSVSIYGNQAVVGAVWANERGGSAYVFIKQGETWTTQGKFEGEKPDDQFGWSVSIYEETIAVGAIKFDDRTTGPLMREIRDRGSVNIYVKDDNGSWYRETRLEPSDGKEGDHFGRSIDLHDDWLIVSAPFSDEMGVDAGTAYIYQRQSSAKDDWLLQAKVLPTQEAALSEFGFSVGVSNENFVVSSKYFNQETDLLGNAYIYNTRNPNDPTASPTLSHLPTEGTAIPTRSPSSSPTKSPTKLPTPVPTTALPVPTTEAPTRLPSQSPSSAPSEVPTTVVAITAKPSSSPSSAATTRQPSEVPSSAPSEKATTASTSTVPSGQPSAAQPLPNIPTNPPTVFGESSSSKPSVDGTYRPTPGPPGASPAPSAGTNSTASPSASTNGTAAPTPFGDFTESPMASNTTRMPTYSPTTPP